VQTSVIVRPSTSHAFFTSLHATFAPSLFVISVVSIAAPGLRLLNSPAACCFVLTSIVMDNVHVNIIGANRSVHAKNSRRSIKSLLAGYRGAGKQEAGALTERWSRANAKQAAGAPRIQIVTPQPTELSSISTERVAAQFSKMPEPAFGLPPFRSV
jgi:hypothetical protein